MGWAEHMERTWDTHKQRKILIGKPEGIYFYSYLDQTYYNLLQSMYHIQVAPKSWNKSYLYTLTIAVLFINLFLYGRHI
jgi:hypothetical protein